MILPKSSMNPRSSRIRTSPTKRARTEVVLAISADGRAQAKATVVYQQPAVHATVTAIDGDDNISSGYDSFEESDSSFDGDAPRGMAPDGSEYLSYRRRRCSSAVGSDQMFHSSTNLAASFGAPRTPKRARGVLARVNGRRNRAESASTTLPTPLKSSPPPLNGHIRRSQSFATNPTPQLPQFEDLDEDGSEAETVVDEPIELPMDIGDADGDALTALKRLLAQSRAAGGGGGAGSSPAMLRSARPRNTLKRTYGTLNRSGKPGSTHDTSSSSPIMSRTTAVPTPRRKFRRRPLADGGFHYRHHLGNASPTTVTDPDYDSDRALSDVDGDATGETRCVCGRQDDGGKTMVECDSCKYWLHLKCLGYGNRRTLPKVFICTYCIHVRPQPRHRTRS